ncbi:SUMF1/EgtB/PvdO family nonheme iron enzyme [Porphyromonadaceae bacterium OttesenSCG-928-L07]|nr:SUMF1/EgtB/PvdO family nonheme iron enzyme [Porphyromonadaceae bacterium OttesenSCG-928-L07]MDL2251619.1 SUMF1/EgtB/PvdO family nonheme iron enzyme [Odoribacter sp. OttesenSCG-928-J03]MDL2330681.1 SUMF1/EgtB/PvdO family nonheme iron enzyme [Odoribacter sp. OttesenSCG-928-A06]
MQIKRFVLLFIIAILVSCSPYNGGGELVGTRKTKKWFEPSPYGMVLIPTGSLIIGQNDEDIAWSLAATQKTVSIAAFWMDETEITNDEYRQFIHWVLDSIKRQRLVDEGFDEFLMKDRQGNIIEPPVLNKMTRIDFRRNEEYREALAALEYSGDDRLVANEFDIRKLIYKYSWYDLKQAAINDRFYDPVKGEYTGGFVINAYGEKEEIKGRSSFIMRKEIKIYPDTLSWLKDFTYAYNEPYVKEYFSHPGYDNYPVVGINWHQAQAFCHWRSELYNNNSSVRVQPWRLPSETEWEYAARGGLIGQKYPWGGPYVPTKKGCFVANFKPRRGNYIGDGGSITVPVGTYEPNGYGLYDMAGNVAEWTSDSYDESAYAVVHDMNPSYSITPKESDNRIFKRKVIRGGSWKDIAFFLQNGVRTYEYQDSARSFIGFRTVRTKIEL